jgi:deazaflavin-dependent oxidoreductase (nitroreductase family)
MQSSRVTFVYFVKCESDLALNIFLRFLFGLNIFFYKATGGRVSGSMRGAPILLLTSRGRKSGKERTTPVLYLNDGSNLVVVASNGGREKDPSWWVNLKHNPSALVQIKREIRKVRAEKASSEEKSRLWPLLTKMYPTYDDYQHRTKREIPVVILKPTE